MEDNPTPSPEQTPRRRAPAASNLGIPIAIVVAGGLIAGAVYLGGGNSGPDGTQVTGGQDNQQETPEANVAPVTEEDHIRGNPNAPILLVEYSDYDCPFCKRFHDTMKRVMDEYGQSGDVAWVYRHFPLEQLHPNAPMLAESAECVAELGGNEAFWTYTDLIFAERGTNEQTNPDALPGFAEEAGVNPEAFNTCLESGKYEDAIQEDYEEAVAAGGRGTPHTIVMVGDQQGAINGAQEYPVVKQIIDGLLSQIQGGELQPSEE